MALLNMGSLINNTTVVLVLLLGGELRGGGSSSSDLQGRGVSAQSHRESETAVGGGAVVF